MAEKIIVKSSKKSAFTLIELSIVIVIISILITGALSVSINAINNSKNNITKERLDEIYKAIGRYLLTNKRIPCPAPITDTKSNSANYGVEASTSLCASTAGVFESSSSANLVRGMLPVKTLGLPLDMAEDGFGNKFEYIVDKNYTIASAATAVVSGVGDFGTSTTANLNVFEKPGSSAISVETAAIFAVIGLGANKLGAYGSDANTRNSVSTDAEESCNTPNSAYSATCANSCNNADTCFGNRVYTSSSSSDSFDDKVIFASRNKLISDFNAFSLIPCLGPTTDIVYESTTISWPNGWYDQVVTSTTACPSTPTDFTKGVSYPTRRCGAFGNWENVINPCVS